MIIRKKSCCVFGHRTITKETQLKVRLTHIIKTLIEKENVDTFYVGSRSEFDDLCRQVLLEQKIKYPHIKRIYVRAEYPDISEEYENYLFQKCDETYFPKRAREAGKGVYIERNREMIDKSDICIVYFKYDYLPPKYKNCNGDLRYYQPKSGTAIAYKYAIQKKKKIINLAENI